MDDQIVASTIEEPYCICLRRYDLILCKMYYSLDIYNEIGTAQNNHFAFFCSVKY